MKHLGDITKIDWSAVEPVDVVTGGSPCQDLSVAGKRAGLAGERSGLYMEQIRCVKELREADVLRGRAGQFIRPRYMVWENVPGAFSSGKPKGADFAAVIEEIIKVAEPDAYVCVMPPDSGWTKSGCYYDSDGRWSIAWRVHDAQFWGVPQRRKRISLVADFGGLSAPEILFERKGLHWHSEQSGTAREGAAGEAEGGVGDADCYNYTLNTSDRHALVYDARDNGDGETVCTLTGDHQNRVTDYTALCVGNGQMQNISMAPVANTLDTMHDQQAIMRGSVVRRLTPLECERLQGYPDGWTDIGDWVDSKGKQRKCSDAARYKALGNSIALPFWKVLARRIGAQYDRDITMGSLFDGIGGFPLVFEQTGAKAVWASEIEEFPMAVTKVRFG